MATKAYYPRTEIGPGKVGFAKTRSIIEAAFYGNNVIKLIRHILEIQHPGIQHVLFSFWDQQMRLNHEFRIEPDKYLCMVHGLPSGIIYCIH